MWRFASTTPLIVLSVLLGAFLYVGVVVLSLS